MNRLIIIGNGFDLAHGMPTGYSDFMKWYLITLFKKLGKEDFEDDGIRGLRNRQTSNPKLESSEMLIKLIETRNETTNKYLETILNNQFVEFPNNNTHPFFINFKYQFLKDICLIYAEKNWVDIENLFYKKLLGLTTLNGHDEPRNNAVDLLNKGMNYLKNKLEEYLATIPLPDMNREILDIINSEVNEKEFYKNKKANRQFPVGEIVFLNFNYTRTIINYLGCINRTTTQFVNVFIHGELRNNKNPLIFGFGDEMDDHYKVLEKTNYNGFLDNVKSFGYFETGNYQEITSFINSDEPFEVFIMGHSCGLSDRVMLNMIFEHHNCKSIKIFYYGDEKSNNYKTLTQEISRHFNKKNDMRLKIVPFEDSIPLPQLK
jgi:hypothetical protein